MLILPEASRNIRDYVTAAAAAAAMALPFAMDRRAEDEVKILRNVGRLHLHTCLSLSWQNFPQTNLDGSDTGITFDGLNLLTLDIPASDSR